MATIDIRVDHYFHLVTAAPGVDPLNQRIEKMSAQLEALQAAVAADIAVDSAAITLLQGLKARLDEAIASADSVAALQALSDQLGASTAALAAAVSANTPAAVAPAELAAPTPAASAPDASASEVPDPSEPVSETPPADEVGDSEPAVE